MVFPGMVSHLSQESAGIRPCRESEGVPRFLSFLSPQEWGIKGVEIDAVKSFPLPFNR